MGYRRKIDRFRREVRMKISEERENGMSGEEGKEGGGYIGRKDLKWDDGTRREPVAATIGGSDRGLLLRFLSEKV